MRWRLDSERFGLHLSLETKTVETVETEPVDAEATEPVGERPAGRGRGWSAWQTEGGFMLIVLFLGTLSALTLFSEAHLDQRGVETTATVVNSNVSRKGVTTTTFRFTDLQNRPWTRTLKHIDAPPAGTPLRVVYDPGDPTRVKPADPGLAFWRLLAVAGAVAIVVGRALSLLTRRVWLVVPGAIFLVLWLGGMLLWELVVS